MLSEISVEGKIIMENLRIFAGVGIDNGEK